MNGACIEMTSALNTGSKTETRWGSDVKVRGAVMFPSAGSRNSHLKGFEILAGWANNDRFTEPDFMLNKCK